MRASGLVSVFCLLVFCWFYCRGAEGVSIWDCVRVLCSACWSFDVIRSSCWRDILFIIM